MSNTRIRYRVYSPLEPQVHRVHTRIHQIIFPPMTRLSTNYRLEEEWRNYRYDKLARLRVLVHGAFSEFRKLHKVQVHCDARPVIGGNQWQVIIRHKPTRGLKCADIERMLDECMTAFAAVVAVTDDAR